MKKIWANTTILILLLFATAFKILAQQTVFLSDTVNKDQLEQEKITRGENGEITGISNVNVPSMTVYLPDNKIATGTGVIVLPGGALRFLSWENEGTKVAKSLNEKGIAAFVLKYRLNNEPMEIPATGKLPPMKMMLTVDQFDQIENANTNPSDDPKMIEVLNLADDDVKKALQIIRNRTDEWNINPEKIGYLGFSAGGGVALGAVSGNNAKECLPDFIATIYGPSLIDVVVPSPAPPMFIATAADHMNVAAGCLALFTEWKKAGGEAELHIYGKGNRAFGMSETGSTSDKWMEHFCTWMASEGF